MDRVGPHGRGCEGVKGDGEGWALGLPPGGVTSGKPSKVLVAWGNGVYWYNTNGGATHRCTKDSEAGTTRVNIM